MPRGYTGWLILDESPPGSESRRHGEDRRGSFGLRGSERGSLSARRCVRGHVPQVFILGGGRARNEFAGVSGTPSVEPRRERSRLYGPARTPPVYTARGGDRLRMPPGRT